MLVVLAGVTAAISGCQDSTAPANPSPSSVAVQGPTFTKMASGAPIADEYIVVLKSNVSDVSGKAKGLLKTGTLRKTYSKALHGFAAHMSEAEARSIASDPSVAYVEQDRVVQVSTTQINQRGESIASTRRRFRWIRRITTPPLALE